MLKRRRPDGEDNIMKTAVEVASVKAQAQAIIIRVKLALDELAYTVDLLPGDEEDSNA